LAIPPHDLVGLQRLYMVPVLGTVPLIVPQPFDILAAIALIYGAGVLTGFNLARRVTGFMLGGRRS
jgi:hypothetical protein